MKAWDLLKICLDDVNLLDEQKKEFILKLKRAGCVSLTGAQYQYLQSCYDIVVGKKYGLEPMSTDKETAAMRAIKKTRENSRG